MTIDNKLFDDLTRMAGGAANIMAGIGKQISTGLKDQLKDQMSGKFAGFPFAPFSNFGGGEREPGGESGARDENAPNDLNRLLGMVSQFRLEQEAIKERLRVIEKALGIEAAPSKPAATSPVSKAAKASKTSKTAEPVKPMKSAKAPAKPKAKKSIAAKA